MTLLGKYSNHIDGNTNKNNNKNEYRLPAVLRQESSDMPFYKSFLYSVILHPLVIFVAWLLIFILSLLGINFSLFQKPKMPQRDIEFVLVDKEGTPINKNTKYRSDRNSRAGGIHDPNRPVSIPQTAAPKGEAKSPQPKAPEKKKSEPPKQQKAQPKPQPQPQKQAPKTKAPQPKVQTPQPKAPEPKTEAPKTQAPKVAAPKLTQQAPKAPVVADKPKSDFVIPVPKSEIPPVQPSATAPIRTASGSGSGVNSGSKAGSGSGTPAPSFSPTSGGGSGSGSGGGAGSKNGRFSGTGTGSGNVGNPGPGNPKGAPGIDAIKEPDFGPYMRELQRRIKMNWDPPKGNESKRVVLLFSISKDGRLLSIKVHKSSGLTAADNAAMSAVKLTAPFKPLPAEFKGQSVDIQFTFDYNVFGGSLH